MLETNSYQTNSDISQEESGVDTVFYNGGAQTDIRKF